MISSSLNGHVPGPRSAAAGAALPAAARRLWGGGRRRRPAPRRRHDRAGGRLRERGRRRPRARHRTAPAERRPARVRAAHRRRQGPRGRQADRALRRRPRRLARGRDRQLRRRRAGDHARRQRPARRRRPALVAGSAQRDRRRGRAARGADRRRSPRRPHIPRQRRGVHAAPRAPRPRSGGLHRQGPGAGAHARYHARRLGLLRPPLRHPRRRRRDPLPLDGRAALRGRDRRAGRDDPARARQGGLRRELRQPRRRAGDRSGVGGSHRPRAVGRHARAGGLGRRDLRRLDRLQHRRARGGPQRRRGDLPARGPMIDLGAPYVQRALLEMLLLAVPAGLLGSWIVLRRLAFFSHAVGTVSFPALVLASAWGIAPQLAALVAALGFGVAQERLERARRLGADAATGLLLVGALAAGVVLASDVFESGTEVDTLLFGSLIGLGERPVLADRLLLAGVAATAVVALDAVGALLVTVVLVVPAATARLLTDRLAQLQLAAIALAAVEGVGAVWLADAMNVGAGPALAVLGGAVFALVAATTALRARAVPA